MIDFACKQFKLEEVIKCGLGLSKADYKLLEFLLQQYDEWFTTDDLAKRMKLNLSTIQRSVKKLSEKQVIKRSQNNLDGGGYMYVYQIKDKDQIRELMMNIVTAWVKRVDDELKKW
ncbi:MarR family transcriptional regulator [Candidatus Woesearchaeota archaeon]|jgi:predicted transcriptional regulator|nr:MarR family transcriptional regulator [Candidatus Woesearchaeota archaeon]